MDCNEGASSPGSSRSKNRNGVSPTGRVSLGRACLCMLSDGSRLTNEVDAWYSRPERRDMRPLAVITGSSSGIGATFATQLAAQNFDLLLVARRRDRLEELAGTLERSHTIKAEILPADLTVDEELGAVEQRIAAVGNLELLVNNAGF